MAYKITDDYGVAFVKIRNLENDIIGFSDLDYRLYLRTFGCGPALSSLHVFTDAGIGILRIHLILGNHGEYVEWFRVVD